MHFRVGDTHRRLRRHACLFRPFNRRNDIPRVVQSAEDTGDIHALRVLHFVHQLPDIRRHGVHTQCVQSAVQHVCLDTCLVEELREGAHRLIGVLAIQQVHLLARTAVRLHAVKATHVDNHGRNLC